MAMEGALHLPSVKPYRRGDDFERWLSSAERYMCAIDVTDPDRKCAVILHLLGEEVGDVYDTLPDPETPIQGDSFEQCKAKLITYLTPGRNVISERMRFHAMTQQAAEEFEAFLARLRAQLRRCGYSAAERDRELRDRCVGGCVAGLQEKLLRTAAEKGDTLTLENVRSVARIYRDVRELSAQFAGAGVGAHASDNGLSAARVGRIQPASSESGRRSVRGRPAGGCYRCGSLAHWKRDCPENPRSGSGGASGGGKKDAKTAGKPGNRRTCFRCGQPGHFKAQCSQTNAVSAEGEDTAQDTAAWCVHTISPAAAAYATPVVNGRRVSMLVDTGSPVTLISSDFFPELTLGPTSLQLTSFTGHPIPLRGEAQVSVADGDQPAVQLRLVVTDIGPHRPLMGREWISRLGCAQGVLQLQTSLTLSEVLDKHAGVFAETLGKIPIKVDLPLKEGAKPVYRPARPVPYALREAVDAELDRWEREGIAEKVAPGHFSGWGTPLVPVPKEGGVRLCADYRGTVNPQLKPVKYPLRTPEDLFASIRGKRFAKLDCKNAYLQCELAESSKDMTTVTTHRGAYRMNRLPYGINVCGAVFQALMDQILDGIPGTFLYLDDCLLTADTDDELLRRLDQVLTRLGENGVRLRRSKCEFNVREVTYLGWKLSATELKPLSDKTEAVRQAPEPRNVQELRSLIGSVSYYQRLLPNLATVLAPLYALLKKDARWQWTSQCAEAVALVKEMLTSSPVLLRYDPGLPLRLVTDASATGVGAALLMVTPDGLERPVQYASRTLTPTERKYAQVEKEAAAVSFGVRRFHQFLYGREFTLVVDNRALSRILSPDRDLPGLAAARMQRYALQLAAYQYKVELRRTEDMRVADVLSRLSLRDPAEEERADREAADQLQGSVLYVADTGPALSARDVAAVTRRDPVLARVLAAVRSGWPAVVDPDLAPFKTRRDELTTEADCVLWGGRVIVPAAMQAAVKRELHEGHFGCARMKTLARRFVWWPGLDAELEALARDCVACAEKRASPPHAARHPWEAAAGPWQRLHADFAGPVFGRMFLVIVDSFSKWLEVLPMTSTTAAQTVGRMRDIFARLGLPLQIVTDNGPQFASREFAEFASANGIRHIRVAPYHPSSNGLAERAVGTFKSCVKATVAEGGSLDLALARFLMAYRSSPHTATNRTPAEMLLGRNLRTRLNLLVPCAETTLLDAAQGMEQDAGGRRRSVTVGAAVWCRCYSGPAKWVRGTVVAQSGPVSYEVDVGHAVWSRHIDQLWPAGAVTGHTGGSEPTERQAVTGPGSGGTRLLAGGGGGEQHRGTHSGGATPHSVSDRGGGVLSQDNSEVRPPAECSDGLAVGGSTPCSSGDRDSALQDGASGPQGGVSVGVGGGERDDLPSGLSDPPPGPSSPVGLRRSTRDRRPPARFS